MRCGDAKCTAPETLMTCPVDCSTCGDMMCTGNENNQSCPADCPMTPPPPTPAP